MLRSFTSRHHDVAIVLPFDITMLRSISLRSHHPQGRIDWIHQCCDRQPFRQFLSGRCRYDVASSAPDWRRSMTRRTGLSRAVGARLAKPRGLGQSGPCGWPGMGRSEERPSFDGLCPALTQNGVESRTLPVRFSLDAQKRSGGLRYFWQCVHMPVSLQAPPAVNRGLASAPPDRSCLSCQTSSSKPAWSRVRCRIMSAAAPCGWASRGFPAPARPCSSPP